MNNQGFAQPWFALVWVFGWAGFFLLVWHFRYLRRRDRLEMLHKERMHAMEKGIPLPELSEINDDDRSGRSATPSLWSQIRLNPRWPLGVGALLAMTGVGIILALRLSAEDYHNRVWSFGLIPIFVGIGLWFHYYLTRRPGE